MLKAIGGVEKLRKACLDAVVRWDWYDRLLSRDPIPFRSEAGGFGVLQQQALDAAASAGDGRAELSLPCGGVAAAQQVDRQLGGPPCGAFLLPRGGRDLQGPRPVGGR